MMGMQYTNKYRASSRYELTGLTKHDPRYCSLTISGIWQQQGELDRAFVQLLYTTYTHSSVCYYLYNHGSF